MTDRGERADRWLSSGEQPSVTKLVSPEPSSLVRPSQLAGMEARALLLGVTICFVLAASASSPLGAATGVGVPATDQPRSVLTANATFEGWTWSGNPCEQGTIFTAHFLGNATGGTPPYRFDWDFGDGSPNSTVQDPSHTFSSGGGWNVTLTVHDSTARSATAWVDVQLPAFACPSVSGQPGGFLGFSGPTGYFVLAGLLALAVLGPVVAAILLERRSGRLGRESP